jgi:hypothetical protein
MGTDDVCRAGSVRVTLQNRLPRKGTVYVFPEVTSEIKKEMKGCAGLKSTNKKTSWAVLGPLLIKAFHTVVATLLVLVTLSG